MIEVKTPDQIDRMRKPCLMVGKVLAHLSEMIKPGVTTQALDDAARDLISELGGKPAFKGYRGFPAHICASVNTVVVHGIPGETVLQEGDIVGIDVGVEYDGYFGDAAFSAAVGRITPEAQKLMDVTQECLAVGIAQARPGGRVGDIGAAVQAFAESHGFGVVREFTGHGIGTQMHQDPQVPNFGKAGFGALLKEGMCLAIEPMINAGRPEVEILEDGWTVVTQDGSLAAHFEHSIAITANGPEILTEWPKKKQ
ncbi:MAG: type I methionyl aminopeptidase [Candidatus Omnitrophica bacterium]|nr:type I methionyl aminopeptidase [Candidatus Omnitrophota bacterium]